MRNYINPAMKQLRDQQVRYAPVEKRLEQLDRAEKLLTEISDRKNYPYQYICYRITGFRSTAYPNLVLEGKELEHDLALFIRDLAETVPAVPAEQVSEPVLTLDEVSHRLNVSTKTISRWRNQGLLSRRILCDGRQRVGIRQSLLRRFLERNNERIERSSRFSQVTPEERADILRQAKRMAAKTPEKFAEICRRVARRVGRSPETVRYIIKNHDRDHPEAAIFPGHGGPLNPQDRQAIYASYRRGISIDAIARRFHRARTSVYRIINQVRAERLMEIPIDYIPHESFDDPKKEAEILAPMPDADEYEAKRAACRQSVPKGLPPELAALYEVPLLNREQEAHLFRQMNFLKHKAVRLRERIDPSRARTSDLDELESLIKRAQAVKDQLVSANMRLVASIVKRHVGPNDNFFELLSDGNLSLLRAVEKFDFSRGNKFSTYASWAIMKNFARSIPEQRHHRERFQTGYDEVFESAMDTRTDEYEVLATAERASGQVNRLLRKLDERERKIIQLRAGLSTGNRLTLEQVGKELGITKERVRQLEARTMSKLRNLARAEKIELA